jgi:hypothetical protein
MPKAKETQAQTNREEALALASRILKKHMAKVQS